MGRGCVRFVRTRRHRGGFRPRDLGRRGRGVGDRGALRRDRGPRSGRAARRHPGKVGPHGRARDFVVGLRRGRDEAPAERRLECGHPRDDRGNAAGRGRFGEARARAKARARERIRRGVARRDGRQLAERLVPCRRERHRAQHLDGVAAGRVRLRLGALAPCGRDRRRDPPQHPRGEAPHRNDAGRLGAGRGRAGGAWRRRRPGRPLDGRLPRAPSCSRRAASARTSGCA